MSYLIDQTKLLFWKKMYVSNNVILYSLSCFVFNRFMSVASQYSVVSPASVLSNQLFGRHLLRHSVKHYYFVFYYDFHLASFCFICHFYFIVF